MSILIAMRIVPEDSLDATRYRDITMPRMSWIPTTRIEDKLLLFILACSNSDATMAGNLIHLKTMLKYLLAKSELRNQITSPVYVPSFVM